MKANLIKSNELTFKRTIIILSIFEKFNLIQMYHFIRSWTRINNPGYFLTITVKAAVFIFWCLERYEIHETPHFILSPALTIFPSKHQIQYEMELPFLLYIFPDWSIFHRGNTWLRHVIRPNVIFIFYVFPISFQLLFRGIYFSNTFYFLLRMKVCEAELEWVLVSLGFQQKVLVCVLQPFFNFSSLTQKLFQPSDASKKQ